MQLLELVIMSSGVNSQLSRFLLLRLSAINICQWCTRFCNQISVAARTFYRRYLLVYFLQFASMGNTFTFKITAMNIGVHKIGLFIASEKMVISIVCVSIC